MPKVEEFLKVFSKAVIKLLQLLHPVMKQERVKDGTIFY
jgi:hypothetical protein